MPKTPIEIKKHVRAMSEAEEREFYAALRLFVGQLTEIALREQLGEMGNLEAKIPDTELLLGNEETNCLEGQLKAVRLEAKFFTGAD